MSFLDSTLGALGIGQSAPTAMSSSIDQFNQQNMSPRDIYNFSGSIPRTVGGIPGIGSRIPGLGKIPIPGVEKIDRIFGPLNSLKFGASGAWESLQYADDLNEHHPKHKFLFKVLFEGFVGRDFYYFVHKVDKPRVKFNHTDVNYYNFRSRVLTSVTYEPLQVQFLDEIGNSLQDFFVSYLRQRSGTGSGHYGIDKGFGPASSSRPYNNGYADKIGQRIIVEQIFGNGMVSNRFIFINPRIESFDFDDLNMEDSNIGSMATISFSYDAIDFDTVYGTTIHSWGDVDLLRGGGTSGIYNAGDINGVNPSTDPSMSVDGSGVYGNPNRFGIDQSYDQLRTGSEIINNIPNSLGGLISGTVGGVTSVLGSGVAQLSRGILSSTDVLSQGIQGTLGAITSGTNMLFGGRSQFPTLHPKPPIDLKGTEYI